MDEIPTLSDHGPTVKRAKSRPLYSPIELTSPYSTDDRSNPFHDSHIPFHGAHQ